MTLFVNIFSNTENNIDLWSHFSIVFPKHIQHNNTVNTWKKEGRSQCCWWWPLRSYGGLCACQNTTALLRRKERVPQRGGGAWWWGQVLFNAKMSLQLDAQQHIHHKKLFSLAVTFALLWTSKIMIPIQFCIVRVTSLNMVLFMLKG